jgi:hypothetical protein
MRQFVTIHLMGALYAISPLDRKSQKPELIVLQLLSPIRWVSEGSNSTFELHLRNELTALAVTASKC